MTKHLLLFFCALFLSIQVSGQVRGRLTLSEDQTTYEFYITPDFNQSPPLSTTNNSQISLVAPVGGLEIVNFQSVTGNWNGLDLVKIESPVENPGFLYVSIPLSSPMQDIVYEAGVEILMFTFQNEVPCLGSINIVDNETDPFLPPNSQSVNIGNLFTILGVGPRNAYEGTDLCCVVCPGEEEVVEEEEEMEEEVTEEEEEMEEEVTEEEEEMEEEVTEEEEETEEEIIDPINPIDNNATPPSDEGTHCNQDLMGWMDISLNPEKTGVPPYKLVWTNTTTQQKDSTTIQEVFETYRIEDLSGGNYIAVVTDAQGNSFSVEGDIEDNSYFLNPVLAVTDAACGNTGKITISYPEDATGTYTYEWDNGEDTRNLEGLAPDTYQVTVTDNNGCTAIKQAFITAEEEGINANILPTNISCKGMEDGRLSIETNQTENYSYQWEGNGISSTESSLENLSPGEYTVTVSTINGACEQIQTVSIIEPEELSLSATIEAKELCDIATEGTILIDEINNGQGAIKFAIDNGEFTTSRAISVPTGATYTVTAQDENGCTASTTVEMPEAAGLSLDLPERMILELGDEMELEANYLAASTVQFKWADDPSLSCTDCPNPTINPTQTTTYTLILSDDNGCSKEATIIVFLSKTDKIYIPNAFSPNNDGINDYFNIYTGSNVESVNSLQIFNRWGDRVFQSSSNYVPNESGWNGQFNGRVATPGVYVYFADVTLIDGTTEIISGEVNLMK